MTRRKVIDPLEIKITECTVKLPGIQPKKVYTQDEYDSVFTNRVNLKVSLLDLIPSGTVKLEFMSTRHTRNAAYYTFKVMNEGIISYKSVYDPKYIDPNRPNAHWVPKPGKLLLEFAINNMLDFLPYCTDPEKKVFKVPLKKVIVNNRTEYPSLKLRDDA